MSLNSNLHKAKAVKNDEFYTQISDIEKELKHYEKHFNNKHVFCNCDDPEISNFWRYFALNFKRLNIKRLTSTHYSNNDGKSYRMDMFKEVPVEYLDRQTFMTLEESGIELPLGYITSLEGDGDFRSDESVQILKQSDIIVTNPPFSLVGDYITQLINYNKKFLVIGNQNGLTTKTMYPLLEQGLIWTGVFSGNMKFRVPNSDEYKREGARFWIDDKGDYWRSLGNICWYTNLDHYKRHEDLILYKKYDELEYDKFLNYNAINVNTYKDIPEDYYEPMGVPITYLYRHNPSQFEIINANDLICNDETPRKPHGLVKDAHGKTIDKNGKISAKPVYPRVVIRRKKS